MRCHFLLAAFLLAGCGDDSSPAGPSPIGEVNQHAESTALGGEGIGTDNRTPISSAAGPSPTNEFDQYSESVGIDGESLGAERLPQMSVQGTTPLTASFSGVPANHDDSAFSFVLDLSEDIAGLSYQTLRDNALTVTQGTVTNASRQAPPSNQSWDITVEPEAGESVGITLPATTDCSATGAICTPSGRMLSNHTSATVAPPTTGTPTVRTSATVEFQDTEIDPGSKRNVTIVLNQTGTIPARRRWMWRCQEMRSPAWSAPPGGARS